MPKELGVLIYDDAQPMDIIGPWEVFAFWKSISSTPINMHLIAENAGNVKCVNGITLQAHLSFNDAPKLDFLIVPGGKGRQEQVNNPRLINFIKQQADNCERILSVCTGSFLVHKAGLLSNDFATTYWRALPELKQFNDIKIKEQRIVKNKKIWLSGGISSGIDLALAAIAEFASQEEAGKVQLLFEYFPSKTLYASAHLVDELPLYHDKYAAELPEYIREYLQKKKS